MNLSEYIVDQDGISWSDALAGWGWLLPAEFELWFVTRLCDLIIVDADGAVRFVDVSAGSIETVASSREEFFGLVDAPGNGDNWFAFSLVAKCVESGQRLSPGRCYGLAIPSVLGGEYSVENVRPIDIREYLSFLADVHKQIADLPDGAQVEFRVVA
jgi:hypothetical protein